jgi:hypothetical protein
MMKKIFLSGLKTGIVFPRIGRQTPTAPAKRIEAIATALYFKASDLFLPSPPPASHVHSAKARVGSSRSKQMKVK